MMKLSSLSAAALLLGAFALQPTRAAIEALDLPTMLTRVDQAVQGQVVDRSVFRVDHPTEGRMFFTTITVRGTSLVDGRELTVPVTFLGGYVSPSEGTRVSEMPADHVTQVGQDIVAFYRWSDDMGYGVAANALYAAHGGVYTVVEKGSKEIVLGRGQGYAIEANTSIAELRPRIQKIAADLVQQGKQFK